MLKVIGESCPGYPSVYFPYAHATLQCNVTHGCLPYARIVENIERELEDDGVLCCAILAWPLGNTRRTCVDACATLAGLTGNGACWLMHRMSWMHVLQDTRSRMCFQIGLVLTSRTGKPYKPKKYNRVGKYIADAAKTIK